MNTNYRTLQVTLPRWIITLLRRRAKKSGAPFSSALESCLLDAITLAEVQETNTDSRGFQKAFEGWFRATTRKR